MSVFDHFPIIEGICKHLGYRDLKALSCVSRKCAKFFKDSGFLRPFKLIHKNPKALYLIENPTEQMCIDALKQNPELLNIITNHTEEICLTAVKEDGRVLYLCKKKTKNVCLEAIKRDGYALSHIEKENRTKRLCVEAVKRTRDVIFYVPNKFKYLFRDEGKKKRRLL